MAVDTLVIDGATYKIAPMEPELHDHPSPSYPMVITPAIAKRYLQKNYRNRNQRDKGKREYGADMAEGNFDINGDAIRFSRPLFKGEDERVPEGDVVLLDGQHRLEACVASGAPFVAYVTFGLKPEARRSIDKGIRRKFSDDLKMDGEHNALVLASIILRAHAYSHGDRHLTLKKVDMTNAQGTDFFADHPELRRSTEIAVRTHDEFVGAKLRQSVVGTAHWLFMQADPTLAPEFFARLGDGILDSKDHPIYQLRRRIILDRQKQEQSTLRERFTVPDWQLLCYLIRTWNAMIRNEATIDSKRKTEFALVGRSDHRRMPEIHAPKRNRHGAIESVTNLAVGVIGIDEQLVPSARKNDDA